jgi:hypothetical protein
MSKKVQGAPKQRGNFWGKFSILKFCDLVNFQAKLFFTKIFGHDLSLLG